MSSIELTNVSSGFNLGKINENFQEVERVINEELLHRVNADTSPNSLQTDIDANGQHLYNLPKPSTGGEPLRLKDLFGSPEELLQGPEIEHIVATEGQTIFNLATAYVPDSNSMYVFRNGVLLQNTVDYTESGTQQVTLEEVANVGDTLSFVPVAVGGGVGGDSTIGENLGLGTGIYDSTALNVLKFKSLIPGDNVSFTTSTGSIRINANNTPTTASNEGAGVGMFKGKVADNLQLKSLVAGSNVTISPSIDTITISASLPAGTGEANTTSSVGTGSSIIKDKVGVDLRFKSLKAGSNVSLTANADDITINATGGGGSSQFVSVADYAADATGVSASDSAFNSAASVSGFVYVPTGTYLINASIATSATWWLAPGATITGLASTTYGMQDLSRLTGRIVQWESGQYRTMRVGSNAAWLEKDRWRYSQAISEFSAVSRYSEIGVMGASRTSDNPAQTLGSIGVAAYSVNDSTSPKEPAWGMYVNHQKYNGSGPSYGLEIDNVNKSGVFNATPYNMGDGLTSDRSFNLWLSCGAGDGILGIGNAVSAAIGINPNPTPFNRGIIFPSGSVNATYNEILTSFNGGRLAWYDYQGSVERLSGWISSAGPVSGLDLTIRNQSTGVVNEGIRLDGSLLTVRPFNHATLDLGTSSLRFKKAWVNSWGGFTQDGLEFKFEETYSASRGEYFAALRKNSTNSWINMFSDGLVTISSDINGAKLQVYPDGRIFAGHSTPSAAGFSVPITGKIWFNGTDAGTYMMYNGTNIVLVKGGTTVATW